MLMSAPALYMPLIFVDAMPSPLQRPNNSALSAIALIPRSAAAHARLSRR